MKSYRVIKTTLLIASVALLSSCDLLGLKFQKNAPFDDTNVAQYIDMTALEFIRSRPDLFLSMNEAIEYAGMEVEFTKTGRTFLLLTNGALSSDTNLPTTANPLSGSYFARHKVPNPAYDPLNSNNGPAMIIPSTWDVYPKEQVREFLEYHILTEPVSITESKDYLVFFPTLAYKEKGDTTLVSTIWVRDRNTVFRFNSFTGSRNTNLQPRTSNLKCISGVMHVFEGYLAPPTKQVLDLLHVKY